VFFERLSARRIGAMDSEIISYGGGVNSTALAIMLINEGWKGVIVFSDTGCEWPDTYCFIDYFENEWLQSRGFEIVRLKGMPWHRKGKTLGIQGCSLIEYCEARHVIPMAAVRWCSSAWKVVPLERYQNGRTPMLGIAADEAHRQMDANRPLVDLGITRQGCVDIIEAEGLSIPHGSQDVTFVRFSVIASGANSGSVIPNYLIEQWGLRRARCE